MVAELFQAESSSIVSQDCLNSIEVLLITAHFEVVDSHVLLVPIPLESELIGHQIAILLTKNIRVLEALHCPCIVRASDLSIGSRQKQTDRK